MHSGGAQVKQRTREVIRLSGVLLPIVLTGYGLMQGGRQVSPYGPLSYTFLIVMATWVVLSMVIFLFPSKKPIGTLVRLLLYHFCAGAYVLLVAGFSPPFVALGWALLLLASYIYLSKIGLLLNLSTILVVALLDIGLDAGNGELIRTNLTSIASIYIVGAIIVSLTRIQQADSNELVVSKAQEALQSERLNTLINNLADAVISVDEEGKIDVYNAASLGLLNTNASLHRRPIDNVIKVRDQSGEIVKLFDLAKKSRGLKVRDDLSLDIGDETLRLGVTISPVRSSYSRSRGSSLSYGYVLILRDITKAKSLEEERDEFISVVSHELRTPITIAEGTLSNAKLMTEKGSTPPGMLERSLNDAHSQILFLARMVNDLSTLSRAERGVADAAEKIDIRELMNSLYSEHEPQAKKKGLRFDLDVTGGNGTVTVSRLYLHELLQNFIVNAIKYTKEGSVTLSAKTTAKNVRFEVKDTGIGISKGDQLKIFNKFYRSEDYRTRETGGTGLGLYVANKLARKLGAKISVASRLNYGSSFSFTLPLDIDKD